MMPRSSFPFFLLLLALTCVLLLLTMGFLPCLSQNAVDHLSGFNVAGRYLVVLYYQQSKVTKKVDNEKKKEELQRMKEKYGVA